MLLSIRVLSVNCESYHFKCWRQYRLKAKSKWNFTSSPVCAEWISLRELFTGLFHTLLRVALALLSRKGKPLSFLRGKILLEPTRQHVHTFYQYFFIWWCTCLNWFIIKHRENKRREPCSCKPLMGTLILAPEKKPFICILLCEAYIKSFRLH